jgi:flavodoxin
MNILIVYDTVFGNTGKIAQAMGDALKSKSFVRVIPVADFTPIQLAETDLLILGSPTRGFRATPALMELISAIPLEAIKGKKVAVFDTRIVLKDIKNGIFRFIVKTGGFATKKMAAALKAKEAVQIVEPEGFFVGGEQENTVLNEGELDRAAKWAEQLLPLIQ